MFSIHCLHSDRLYHVGERTIAVMSVCGHVVYARLLVAMANIHVLCGVDILLMYVGV